ncbi:MAG: hypothetical protein M3176_08820 [Chloroflexota bacterium]|nr:hypothetical protein [Chloroflexota bacterium]
MQQKTPEQWIEQFTRYLIERRRLELRLPYTTIEIAIVNGITIDGIGITCVNEGYGSSAGFTTIQGIRELPIQSPIEDIALVQRIRDFASYLMRGQEVRIETRDEVIERAQITQVQIGAAAVTDMTTDEEKGIIFKDLRSVRAI